MSEKCTAYYFYNDVLIAFILQTRVHFSRVENCSNWYICGVHLGFFLMNFKCLVVITMDWFLEFSRLDLQKNLLLSLLVTYK